MVAGGGAVLVGGWVGFGFLVVLGLGDIVAGVDGRAVLADFVGFDDGLPAAVRGGVLFFVVPGAPSRLVVAGRGPPRLAARAASSRAARALSGIRSAKPLWSVRSVSQVAGAVTSSTARTESTGPSTRAR